MAVRNAKAFGFSNFLGLQTFGSAQNLPSDGWWTDSSNVFVTNDGSAAVMRSPKAFNPTVAESPINTVFSYNKDTGTVLLFDAGSPASVYVTDGTTNTFVFDGGIGKACYRQVNNRAYRLNGSQGVFHTTDGTTAGTFFNGIFPPSSGPTITYVAGGSGVYAVGVNVSYAYRNSTTGHISQPSVSSNTLGPTTTSHTIRIGVQGDAGPSTDGIVVFVSTDGGSIRYLLIDSAGDIVVFPNTTGNIDLNIATIHIDTLTPETSYNFAPPVIPNMPFYMFTYKNRLCLTDFRSADTRGTMQYSANEVVYAGVPWESWPPQNAVYTPNRSDAMRGGIETPLGALLFGELDSYLIRGDLTDKISSPTNPIAITETIQALSWSIGTRSPFSAKNTPFGTIWLDQNKRIQIWDYSTFPQEAGLPVRNRLAQIDDDIDSRFSAEGEWFQHGKDGGLYVLTAPISGIMTQFGISIYRDPETNQLRFACCQLDTGANCFSASFIGEQGRLFIGKSDQLFQIMDLDLEGDGWGLEDRFFTVVLGNETNFAYWHSVRFDASSISGLVIKVANLDSSDTKLVVPEVNTAGSGGAYRALLDTYGFRKTITFMYRKQDDKKRLVNNLFAVTSQKVRSL